MRSTQPGSSKKTCAHRPPRGSSLCRHVRACLHALGAAIGKRGSELRGTGAARRGRTAPASDASIFSVVLCSRSQHLTTFSHQPGLSSRACTRLCVRVSLRARVSVCARVCARAHVGRGEPTAALFVSARARVGVRARVCARACRPGGAHRGTVGCQRQLEQLRVRRKPRGESRDELCERVLSVEQRTETIKLPALYHPTQRRLLGEGVQALELPRRHLRGRVRWTRPRRCAMR